MSGYDTDDESEEFSPSQYLKYSQQSDKESDDEQDWVGYSDTLSSLTSSSRGDYVEFSYQPKFTSGLLITNRADVNQNELFCPLVSANLYFFCCMIFQLDIKIMMYFLDGKKLMLTLSNFSCIRLK